MQAVRFHEHGGPDVLQVDEIERPEAGSHRVIVEVDAAGVNPVDTYFREGSYDVFELPYTPGVEFAGTVVETGGHVSGFEQGQRVFGSGLDGSYQGAYAEYVSVPAKFVVPLPDVVDVTAAGGAAAVGATAWRALFDYADLGPSESVLIHGGSGGVGHAAVQVADAVSAHVIATAAPAYHDRVMGLGADVVLDYDREDLADAVRDASDGGVDVVLDHRLDDYLQFDAEVATTGGHVIGIGENHNEIGFSNNGVARSKDVGYRFMSVFNTPDLERLFRGVARLMAADELTIEVARTYNLSEAAEAQRAVLEDSFLGKLVVTP